MDEEMRKKAMAVHETSNETVTRYKVSVPIGTNHVEVLKAIDHAKYMYRRVKGLADDAMLTEDEITTAVTDEHIQFVFEVENRDCNC